MNWLEAVDGYCERVDASVWSEPLNATTNITFLIASVWILRKDGLNGLSRTLAYLLGAIGCASFLFHTLAQAWTGALDVVFILFFTLLYLFAATKDFFGSKISTALLVTIGYLPFSLIVGWLTSPLSFIGSTRIYAPILILILLFAALLSKRLPDVSRGLKIGAFILMISMVMRAVDLPFCQAVPIGTHFLWHTLNAIMLAWMIEVYRRHILSTHHTV